MKAVLSWRGSRDKVMTLLEHGADVNTKNNDG